METKLLEIRDAGTLIPAVAVLLSSDDGWLARRAGYGPPWVLLTSAFGGRKAESDPYAWGDRTMSVAHQCIAENWTTIANGSVIDVEFILGETRAPKSSGEHDDADRLRRIGK